MSKDFDSLARAVDRRLNGGQDVVLMITGDRGSGKSSLAIQLAAYIDPEFTLDQVRFNYPSYFQLMGRLGRGRAGIVDESPEGGRAQNWSHKMNLQTDAVFSTNRKMHQLHMCLDLEKDWLLRVIRKASWRWIHVTNDHIAEVAFDKNQDNKHRDPYWVDEFEFEFDPLPGPLEEAYVKLAKEYVAELGGVRGIAALDGHGEPQRIEPVQLVNKKALEASLRTARTLLEDARTWNPHNEKVTGRGVSRDDVIQEWSRGRRRAED